MHRILRLRVFLLGVSFTLVVGSARAADPMLMLMLNIAQQIVEASERSAARTPVVPPPSDAYPGTIVRPAELRYLIDEGFGYLSEAQRAEVFDALNAELLKAGNASVRAALIEHFAARAMQMRAARQQLANLNPAEFERIARSFRSHVLTLPTDSRERLSRVLDDGLLPIPPRLTSMMLAALDTGTLEPDPPASTASQ